MTRRLTALSALLVLALAAVQATAAEPDKAFEQTGTASYYGDKFHGRKTANGEVHDRDALTAAHPSLPMSSVVEVTNLDNGKTVRVRVNDRGPFAPGRILDLSRRAAENLDMVRRGLAKVRVRYVGTAGAEKAGEAAIEPVPTGVPEESDLPAPPL